VHNTPKFCENCGAPLTPGTRFCERCGRPAAPVSSHGAPPSSARWFWIGGAILAVLVIAVCGVALAVVMLGRGAGLAPTSEPAGTVASTGLTATPPAPTPPPVSPSPTPTPILTPTPQPTYTPYPTYTPPPAGVVTSAPTATQVPPTAKAGPTTAPQPAYGPLVFSSDYDDDALKPLNTGNSFPYGITRLFADWPYSGVTAGTEYSFDWYLNGQLIESNGNVLSNAAGHTFDWYVRDPGASTPLEPGTYSYVARIYGQEILSAQCVIQPPTVGGPVPGAITAFFTIQNGNPYGWVYDKQGVKHTPEFMSITGIQVAAGDRIVLQTDAPRFSLLFDCGLSPQSFSPCDFAADSPGNLPAEIRVNEGDSAYLNISGPDNWAGPRSGHEPQRYPADPVLRIGFSR
jgi:hypothetical protein